MIKAVNLHRSYSIAKKQIEVLHGLDLHIRRGEKVFLCGPSGAGKTTLMYTLAGLEPPQQGQEARKAAGRAGNAYANGFVFQHHNSSRNICINV